MNSVCEENNGGMEGDGGEFGQLDIGFPGAADVSWKALFFEQPADPANDPKPHISSAKAAHEVNVRSLRRPAPDYGKYSIWEIIPWWPPALMGVEASASASNSTGCFLDQYGQAISQYLKMTKALAVIFAFMSVLTLPTLVLFSQSTAVPERELYYGAVLNSQVALATSTLANLGEPIATCREVVDTEAFDFKCPKGFIIESSIAYYGQPTGSCGCPFSNQVDAHTTCPGIIGVDRAGAPACVPKPGAFRALPCFLDFTRFGNRCCATSPNGDVFDIATSLGCNSLTAPYLFAALCNGQSACTLPSRLDPRANYSFPLARLLPFGANASRICLHVHEDMCITTLSHNMQFQGCQKDAFAAPTLGSDSGGAVGGSLAGARVGSTPQPYRLLFEGVCVMEKVTIGESVLDDAYICSVGSALSGLAVICFLLGVSWIKIQVDAEAASVRQTCAASDYTIVLHTLPRDYKDEVRLAHRPPLFSSQTATETHYPFPPHLFSPPQCPLSPLFPTGRPARKIAGVFFHSSCLRRRQRRRGPAVAQACRRQSRHGQFCLLAGLRVARRGGQQS